MGKELVLLGMLTAILLSLEGCGAITARGPDWRDDYAPPYAGVQHAIYSMKNKDPFSGLLLIDLPATFVVDTCLLPWDVVTVAVRAFDRRGGKPPVDSGDRETAGKGT